MQKIIALDIGSYSIKAVEISNTFKSYEISNFYENVIPHIENSSKEKIDVNVLITSCMKQLFEENNIKVDRIITAMPGQYVSSRLMDFNFTDRKKIEVAILFEIEDLVPFELEDIIVDHHIVEQKDKKTKALVVITKKDFLRNFITNLNKINIDPKLIDIDSLSFYNLLTYLNIEETGCYGLIDIGHEKTSLCIVENNSLKMFRTINLGGRYISYFLAKDLQISFNKAQRLKHQVSYILCGDEKHPPGFSDDIRYISERMSIAIGSIVKEIGRTVHSFKKISENKISKIFLFGGSSKIGNLDKYMQEQLGIDVVSNGLENSDIKINPDLENYLSIMPQSISIGLRTINASKKHSNINLRKGEFAYVQDYEKILKYITLVSKSIVAVFMMLILSYVFQSYIYSKKIKDIQKKFKEIYTQTLTKSEKNKFLKNKKNFENLKKNITKNINKNIKNKEQSINKFVENLNQTGPLLALAEISKLIPDNIKVDITFYHFNEYKKITIRGETDAYSSFENIMESLKKSKFIKEVKEKNSGYKPGSDNKILEFIINAQFS